MLLTPHVTGVGPHADERRFAVLLENARRFAAGHEPINLVDKSQWFCGRDAGRQRRVPVLR